MHLSVLGINHHTAPVELREQVAFAPETMAEALDDARKTLGIAEVVILSTCNRTEIYTATEASEGALLRWLADYKHAAMDSLAKCVYDSRGDEAIAHMMRVASGLDSLILGEPQILGQFKSAFTVAREAGAVGTLLGGAFQHTFAIAKRVRTETAIGQNPVSVAYAAVSLAQRIFSNLSEVNALLIGAGETIELVAQYLRQKNIGSITVANRTLSRAADLARAYHAQAILLSDIPDHLPRADMVISSTASQLPILGKGAVESALKQRRHHPMFMVDIAVPRDIEPEVAKLNDVYLYSVDDLREVIEENMRSRQDAARAAERLIELGTDEFMQRMRARAAVDVLKRYRQQAELQRDQELGKALARLERGGDPAQVMAEMARALTNKLLHEPSVQLKRMSAEGRTESLSLAIELFGLDNETSAQGKQ